MASQIHSLEQQVHEALVQKETDKILEKLFGNSCQQMIEPIMKIMFNERPGSSTYSNKLDFFEASEEIECIAETAAQSCYRSRKEVEDNFERSIREKGFYGRIEHYLFFGRKLESFRKENEKLYHFFHYEENIKSELVSIAKREGVENALTDETEYGVIRRIFPTKDEYRVFCYNGLRIARLDHGIRHHEQITFNEREEDNQLDAKSQLVVKFANTIVDRFEQHFKGLSTCGLFVQERWIHEKIQEVYGA